MPIFFLAHAGHPHLEASEVMRWWSFEPVVTATIVFTLVLYTVGLMRSRAVAGLDPLLDLGFHGGEALGAIALRQPLHAQREDCVRRSHCWTIGQQRRAGSVE